MATVQLNILKHDQQHPDPIPADMWLIENNLEKIFEIERATILELPDGRYPQIQLVAKDKETGKYVAIGTTMRLLNMVLKAAKGVAQRQGLKDF